jgi:hypothetical protein
VDIHLPPAPAMALGWVAGRTGGDPECDGPSPICSNPWGLFAVLSRRAGGWGLRLHQRLKDIDNPTAALYACPGTGTPGQHFCEAGNTTGIDAAQDWVRIELTVRGTRAGAAAVASF